MTSPAGPVYAGLSQYYALAASPPLGETAMLSALPLPQMQQKLSNDRLEGEPVYDTSVYYAPFPAMGMPYKRSAGEKGSVSYYTAPGLTAYQQAVLAQQQQQQHGYLQQAAFGGPPPSVPRYPTY
ncbi:uncharacterized protein LOC119110654 [Pollicipes pollicipes]|uniref:uncharacterized protein LOC119110654 n=1 Tax=Pollicipes pollicipes TaxID=41117 RepID=UPI001884C689|nr:uncharacterized protein LOC119110654 [Pollicipes pollicipes]